MSKQTFSLKSHTLLTELTKVHVTNSAQIILSKIYDGRKNVPEKHFWYILYLTLITNCYWMHIEHELDTELIK